MNFLTNDKLVIVGAVGMIGSNMVQSFDARSYSKHLSL